MQLQNSDISTTETAIVDVVGVDPHSDSSRGRSYPARYRQRILVDVIHDGYWIPEEFWTDGDGRRIEPGEIEDDYVRERDWGAHLVAERLAASLGLNSYAHVSVARVLMDFGRFPGSTPRHADHLNRFAINYPFSKWLSYHQKKSLLECYYDKVSDAMEELLKGKLLKIAVHTYDRFNESGTERPPVSLMTRSLAYQTSSELPWGLFDPLYPDVLAEFTSDRILRDRISLLLEKAQVPVAHNYPYCLPEGSLEVRYQVWSYFHYLRERFEREQPDEAKKPGYTMVWEMLLDTNLRSSESETLRSYLHMYRTPPGSLQSEFAGAERAYDTISEFVESNPMNLIETYRSSINRPSAIAIDVRKDVVCKLDEAGRPTQPRLRNIEHIADTIAAAVATYLREDRVPQRQHSDEFERVDPWYASGPD